MHKRAMFDALENALLLLFAAVFTAMAVAGAQAQQQGPVKQKSEAVQADVSTRSVGITSNFTGTEIILFGAISNARDAATDADQYNVVVVLEGVGSQLVSRRKSNFAGIWLNTTAVKFDSVPSYYAIASTPPA